MATILQVNDFLDPYFLVSNIKLPTNGDPTGTILANRNRVQGWINNYEPEGLCLLLGDSLAAELQLYIDALADTPPPPIPRFDDLIAGDSFVGTDGFLYQWKGLKNLLISYVYYYILRTPQFKSLDSGATPRIPEAIDQGWNTSRDLNGDVWRLFIDKKYGQKGRVNEGTAFAYLFANKSDFPNWKFDNIGIQSDF